MSMRSVTLVLICASMVAARPAQAEAADSGAAAWLPALNVYGAVRYRTFDFAAVARACGMEGVVAEDQTQLAAALDGPRPRLVDARIDPTAYRAVIETARG